ncbi:conserved hypothetical protein [Rhodobacteraceae bacterium KLH11]|nr:conserved hypothetical protein [Rhodobacteraceae bacterium KLH11]
MKKEALSTLDAILATSVSTQSLSEDVAASAAREMALSIAVAKGSLAVRNAFNTGDAVGVAEMCEEDAIMVIEPFGTFEGRAAIQALWADIISKGFNDVVYINTTTHVIDQTLTAASVSADWKMNNAKGIIIDELWIMQPDGTALIREAHFEVTQ